MIIKGAEYSSWPLWLSFDFCSFFIKSWQQQPTTTTNNNNNNNQQQQQQHLYIYTYIYLYIYAYIYVYIPIYIYIYLYWLPIDCRFINTLHVFFTCVRLNRYTRMCVSTIGSYSTFGKIAKKHGKTQVEP